MIGNTVTIVGNLTSDPELRFTNSGKAVASISVAFNRRWKDGQGNDMEETSFFDVTAWETLAENVANSLSKGDRVMVEGRLLQRSWETPEGDKRTKVEIHADEIGPCLKWATARPSRNEKPAGGNAPSRPTRQQAFDEEPF